MNKTIEAPQIAKEKGMTRLVFEDDFDSIDTIDVYGTGKEGYKWYTTRPFRAAPLSPDDIKVENSVLTVCSAEPTYGWGVATINPRTRVGFEFCKGVLEFRIRIPRPRANDKEAGEKGIPSIWSFPSQKIYDIALEWIEPDWIEYWGDGYYTTTIHHAKRETMHAPNYYAAANWNSHRGPVAFTDGEWHTMTFLWDDGVIESWLDGKPAVKQTYYEGKDPEPMVKFTKGEYQDDVFKPLNTVAQALILGGSWCNPLEIDWIRVWQK